MDKFVEIAFSPPSIYLPDAFHYADHIISGDTQLEICVQAVQWR